MATLLADHRYGRLVSDPSQDSRDRYGRRLGYLEVAGRDVAETQIRRGWATVYVYQQRRFARYERYRAAQADAEHHPKRRSPYPRDVAPFGVPQIVAAVSAAGSVLDAGCGSARLTLAFAEAGAADVVGIDTSLERLAQGRARLSAHPKGACVKLIEADFDHVLPFSDGWFTAAASRLALMIAADPVATLRELRRVTAAAGRIVTALWAPVDENPWFALPRSAAAAVVRSDRADYARAFGRLGSPEEATEVHRAAGLAGAHCGKRSTSRTPPPSGPGWPARTVTCAAWTRRSASRNAQPCSTNSTGWSPTTAHTTAHSLFRAP